MFSQEIAIDASSDSLSVLWKSHVVLNTDSIPLQTFKGLMENEIPVVLELGNNPDSLLVYRKALTATNNRLNVIADRLPDKPLDDVIKQVIDNSTIDLTHLSFSKADSNQVFNRNKIYSAIRFSKLAEIEKERVLDIWSKSAKVPNFIYANNSNVTEIAELVASLNEHRRVFGVVKDENGFLTDVTFESFKDKKITGYFCFPVNSIQGLPVLVPHKAGFHFSPDIIFTSTENINNLKVFNGFPLEVDFGLSDQFSYQKGIQNSIRKNEDQFIDNNVAIVSDSIFKEVGYYVNRAFLDTGLDSRLSLQGSFTVTAWVKPTELGFNNSILGKGNNFVLKLHEGQLTFTMAGVKDYISRVSIIPLNKWSHIAVVLSNTNDELVFYVNGQESDRMLLIEDYVASEHNLLVGSNLWEEFFVGYLGTIKIWNRELNNDEILFQFNTQIEETSLLNYWWLVVLGFLSIGLYFLYAFKRKAGTLEYSESEAPINKRISYQSSGLYSGNIPNESYKESILCLGKLRIINHEGEDLAKKLSPKLKQLFTIIFLHSYGGEKGIGSKKLTELLWPGMSVKSAKNTRGTNIQNLRNVLLNSSEIALIFKDKHWYLKLSDLCFCDYYEAKSQLDFYNNTDLNKVDLKSQLPKLTAVLKGGRFFRNSSVSWLDSYIEKFSNQVIEQCLGFLNYLDFNNNADILYELTEVIAVYDDLNERSINLKLRVLMYQGKLSLAQKAYDNYVKLYKELFNEQYNNSFEQLISADFDPYK